MVENELKTLLESIVADYRGWTPSDVREERTKEFAKGLSYTVGSKYIKVLTERSVWGFIVAVDNDKKFRKGDILMAAGYNAPARNFARGNILDGNYSIRWTGPLYLR
jgi:hypothetical protein